MLENLREWIENLNVWKTGFKTCVFQKHFISYSCILFIKFNALWSFCTKLLWFFKNLFFPEFRSIESIFRSIEIAIKNFGHSLSVSIDARLILDQSKHFWLIEPNFRSIENRIEFFKNLTLTCLTYFSKSFQTLSLSLSLSLSSIGQGFNPFFCHFPPILLQGFSPLRPVKLFYPSFCIDFQVSCIFHAFFWGNFKPIIFGGFDDSTCFSWNWSTRFCSKTLYNCSWWFNLINLLFCDKLKFLGLKYTRIEDFVQIEFKWWNWLVGLIILIIMNCFLSYVMINWSIWNKLNKWFFHILGILF